MSGKQESSANDGTVTRRRMMTGVALTLGCIVARSEGWSKTQQPAMQEKPGTAANQARTSLHDETAIKASPQRIYEALLDAKQFASFSGVPAEIDPKVGGAFSMFGGQIEGRNVELIPNQRIVQAWRPTHWASGVYSIARFELKPESPGTLVVLDHTGFPEGDFDHLEWGWKTHYWEPLRKFFT